MELTGKVLFVLLLGVNLLPRSTMRTLPHCSFTRMLIIAIQDLFVYSRVILIQRRLAEFRRC